jgi:hypothetical protein
MIRFVSIALVVLLVMTASGCGGGSSTRIPPPPPPSSVPTISSISPTSAVPGSADLKLSLFGSNFLGAPHNLSQATWSANGSVTLLATTFVSSTQLTAVVPASFLTTPVTAQVLLETGDPTGDTPLSKSNSVNFTVSKPFAVAVISSLSPSSAVAGGQTFQLVVTGQNFSQVRRYPDEGHYVLFFGSAQLATTYVSDTQLTAVVPAADIATAGAVSIYAGTADFVSNTVAFNVLPSNGLSISPSADALGPDGRRKFVATLSGNLTPVAWAVQEGNEGGEITSDGLYTAPSAAGTFHVIASSLGDRSQTAAATISVLTSGFKPTGTMTIARSGHTATLLANGKVLVAGGDASAELFDPDSGTFMPTGSMTSARYGSTATLLADGKVLIAGGFGPGTSQLPRLSSAELYDPGSGTFTATGSMAVGRVLHTATLLSDGRVLIAGGTDTSGGGGAATASTELYDPSTGTFTITGSMASERAEHTATLLPSGKVLIVGGWNGHAADAADDPPWDPLFAELFDSSSGTFTSTGSMSTTRIGHSAITLAGGKVLVLGGVPTIQNIHEQPPDPRYAEVYDPAAGTFSSAGSFTLLRTKYTATLLTDGMVLTAGGEQAGIVVTSAELLDPITGTLLTTGGLVIARTGHTATRLNDGRVLVTGGTDSSGNALASAELY